MKTIKIKEAYPVKERDGTWTTIIKEYEKAYSDDQIRHCDLCTMCGYPDYPECTKTCNNGVLAPDKNGGIV